MLTLSIANLQLVVHSEVTQRVQSEKPGWRTTQHFFLRLLKVPLFLLVHISEIKLLQSRLQVLMWVTERDITCVLTSLWMSWGSPLELSWGPRGVCDEQLRWLNRRLGIQQDTWAPWLGQWGGPGWSPGTPTAPTNPSACTELWCSCSVSLRSDFVVAQLDNCTGAVGRTYKNCLANTNNAHNPKDRTNTAWLSNAYKKNEKHLKFSINWKSILTFYY